MENLLSPEIMAYVGRSMPPRRETATRRDIRHYAMATRQRNPKYLVGDEAPPQYFTALFWPEAPLDELRPDGLTPSDFFPALPLKRVMAGGVRVEYSRPIRPGDELVATRKIVDIRQKEGKTGPLIFLETETRIETEAGEPVVTERSTTIAR